MFAGFYVFHIPVNVVSKHIFLEGAIKWREVGSKLKDLETCCLSNNCKSGCFVDAKYDFKMSHVWFVHQYLGSFML